jgi:hypothetical protein
VQELAAAAKAAEEALKRHKQSAEAELQATEASWSAMAADLQDQVSDLKLTIGTLEVRCNDARTQLGQADETSARRLREAQVCLSAICALRCASAALLPLWGMLLCFAAVPKMQGHLYLTVECMDTDPGYCCSVTMLYRVEMCSKGV